MDQVKVGSFLKMLRKEKNLTQEALAEKLGVSNRTVSRWETGSNMPDIGMLVEIADYYDVSIPEIINGERKSETMEQETRETAIAMAEYSHNEVKKSKMKTVGILFSLFGFLIIVSALAMFPSDSSWGSILSGWGSIIMVTGIYLIIKPLIQKRGLRIGIVIGCFIALFAVFMISDYMAVKYQHQVPRFRYKVTTTYDKGKRIEYDTLFYKVMWENPDTDEEKVYIVK